ncbi:hypothetical protein ACQ856_29980 (plasmid) [Mycolicibacterium psychrotolerans]|uniref:hypothetical protein n=1 Tax=Mycolicibacterium psychrotolerans TaxID=216929 RepID=UPI003D66B556
MCLEYSTVAIRGKAMDDFGRRREHLLDPGVGTALGSRHAPGFPDAAALPSDTTPPTRLDMKWRKKVQNPASAPPIGPAPPADSSSTQKGQQSPESQDPSTSSAMPCASKSSTLLGQPARQALSDSSVNWAPWSVFQGSLTRPGRQSTGHRHPSHPARSSCSRRTDRPQPARPYTDPDTRRPHIYRCRDPPHAPQKRRRSHGGDRSGPC